MKRRVDLGYVPNSELKRCETGAGLKVPVTPQIYCPINYSLMQDDLQKMTDEFRSVRVVVIPLSYEFAVSLPLPNNCRIILGVHPWSCRFGPIVSGVSSTRFLTLSVGEQTCFSG